MAKKLLASDFDFTHFLTHNSFDLTPAQLEQFKRQADEIIEGTDANKTLLYACYFCDKST